ncbi:MAG: phosphoglucosamine mutase [Desulfurococcales archaeon]|nr:phosphoglucosamine mutase [Desulfurococcales archaeon]
MGKLFGTDGVRGVVNKELTPEKALKIGMALGAYLNPGSRVLMGRDVRAGGDMLFHAVAAGLQSQGVKVYYAGYIPTPGLQYILKTHSEYDAGVMITASHNPPQYNGIKVISSNGVEVSRETERELEEIYFTQRFRAPDWSKLTWDVKMHDGAIEEYVEGIASKVDNSIIEERGFKVVVDPANSVGGLVTPLLLRKLGVRVYTINGHLDPLFPGREPEPTVDSLKDLSRIVRELDADLGVGHDGDADRAILVDEKGSVWWGDRSGSLIAGYVAEKHPDLPRRVYTGVSSSILVEEYLGSKGIEVKWTPVGSVIISHMILESGGALAGFEENGGYMHPPHQIVRDGAMKTALFLEYMAETRMKPSELFDMLPKYYPIKTKIPMERSKAILVVEKLKEKYMGKYKIVDIDGLKVFGEDYWFLVRPSGTEPVLRIMLEAKTPKKARDLLAKIKEEITRILGEA